MIRLMLPYIMKSVEFPAAASGRLKAELSRNDGMSPLPLRQLAARMSRSSPMTTLVV